MSHTPSASSRRHVLKLGGAAAARLTTAASADAATPGDLSMFAVIFEVRPYPDLHEDYLATARALRPMLDEIDGFDSIDRYGSRERPGWLLSLSFWADETALTEWRTREKHHLAQSDGRERIFGDYRIRVAQVISDDTPGQPTRRPERRSAYNDLSRRRVSYMGFLEVWPPEGETLSADFAAGNGGETMDSLYTRGKVIHMRTFGNEAAASEWRGHALAGQQRILAPARLRVVEVERDYTLTGRAQAPQYYPEVKRALY